VYDACCGPLHRGRAARDAVALMRSRYCAYALGKVTYIVETTCKGQPAFEQDISAWRAQIASLCRETQFVSLDFCACSEQADSAWVSFVAGLEQKGQPIQLAEKSFFLRRKKRWFYASGSPIDANAALAAKARQEA
jgi:SEC-C motif-containing protein